MKTKFFSAVAVAAALASLSFASAEVQAKSVKEQLVGTWTLVSQADLKKDGTKVSHFGSNPKGMLVVDRQGRFSLIIVRQDLPKFSGKTVDDGSPTEYTTVMKGLVAQFGTYSVDEANEGFTTHVEGSWFPNIVGQDQKRTITSLNSGELKYANPTAATGESVEVVWKRAK